MQIREASELTYVSQKSRDLRLCLVSDPLGFDCFQVLASEDIAWYEFTAKLRIIGSSHAVTFSMNKGGMTEVLACVEPSSLPVQPFHVGSVLDQAALSNAAGAGGQGANCHYRFDAISVPLDTRLMKSAAKCRDKSAALYVSFPRRPGDMSPFTLLVWNTTAEGLGIYSVHTYPGEKLAICTLSSFSCVPLGSHLAVVPPGMPGVSLN